ncbi:MAG: hypothetical protein J6D21_05615 [Clostridia bacterium]|nr:hypothetical protein [Clostridia bacterium]
MKRILFLLFFLTGCLLLTVTASAENEVYQSFDVQWEEFLAEIPSDIAEVLPKKLSEPLGDDATKLSVGGILKSVLTSFMAGIGSYRKYLLSLVAVLLLCAVFEILKSTLKAGALHEVLTLAGNLSLSLVIASTQIRLMDYVISYLKSISRIANGILPLMLSVFAASGNFNLAAVHSGGISLVIVLLENVFCKWLAPLLKVCFCFHFVSVFAANRYFDEIHKLLKGLYTTLLAFVMSIFTFVMGAKQILASGADNFIIRGAKYAVSSFVPIVTSAISGSLSTVSTALSVVKNACGIGGILVVLLMLLPVIVSLILNRFVLKLSAGLAGILGEGQQQKFLTDTASINGYLISLTVCGAVLFIYLLALTVMTTLALG